MWISGRYSLLKVPMARKWRLEKSLKSSALLAAVLALAIAGSSAATESKAPLGKTSPLGTVHNVKGNLKHPSTIAAVGTTAWVANADNSVSIIDSGCWCVTKRLKAKRFGFKSPEAIYADGTHVWVANAQGNSVSEFSQSDASLVQVLKGPTYGFTSPMALTSDGTHLWVVNEDVYTASGLVGKDSLVELNLSDGSFVQKIKGKQYGLNTPVAIAFDGTNLWVSNEGGDTLTELASSDGSLVAVRPFWHRSLGDTQPGAMAFDGHYLWVVNAPGFTGWTSLNSVEAINPSTGKRYGEVNQANNLSGWPVSVAFDGTNLWYSGLRYRVSFFDYPNTLTKIDPSTWSNTTYKGSPYGLHKPVAIAAAPGLVWAANQQSSTVTAIELS